MSYLDYTSFMSNGLEIKNVMKLGNIRKIHYIFYEEAFRKIKLSLKYYEGNTWNADNVNPLVYYSSFVKGQTDYNLLQYSEENKVYDLSYLSTSNESYSRKIVSKTKKEMINADNNYRLNKLNSYMKKKLILERR